MSGAGSLVDLDQYTYGRLILTAELTKNKIAKTSKTYLTNLPERKRENPGSEVVPFILVPRVICTFKMAGGRFMERMHVTSSNSKIQK